ncbi:MAG TPA: hypothetical protein VIR63_00905, partial [Pontiella sp.]
DSEVVAIEDAPSLAETMSALEIQSPVEEVPSLAETMSALNVDEPVVPAENFETVAAELVMDAPVEDPTAAFVDEVGLNPADDRGELTTENLISVRLDKVSLEDAINLFAQLSGANIIVPELAEAAPISVNLKDVEWRPALQSILDTYNYELYQRVSGSNVYSVRRRAADAPEPQVVETFLLKYATVPNVAALVRELLPEDAKISEFASRNMLVVKSSESSLSEVRAVLETIDKVRQQVYIESKFMELNDDAVKMLGINWALLQTDEQGNHKGYQAGLGDLKKTKSRGETYSRSGGRYYDATGSEFAFGPQDALSEGQLSNPNGPGIDIWNGLTPSISSVTGLDKSEVITSVLDADDFRVMLSALEDNADINIVSNPKIIVANEESANISIVRKEPNLKQERQQTAGAAAGGAIDNTTFELDPDRPFFEYGVTLDVVPSINTTSNITMKIKPAITRFVRDKPAGEVTYPIYDEKSVETVFSLASGQTAAIGGLTEVSEGEEEKKVPLLGDIPYLGRLFSWKRTTQGIQETVIFVTVGLANTHQITEETGMPSDAELARRRVISDNNNKQLRARSRSYFIAGEGDRVEDARKIMDRVEEQRVEQRRLALERAQEKAEKAST